jgi:hypothetical protein
MGKLHRKQLSVIEFVVPAFAGMRVSVRTPFCLERHQVMMLLEKTIKTPGQEKSSTEWTMGKQVEMRATVKERNRRNVCQKMEVLKRE